MVKLNQDFRLVRGDKYSQPYSVDLDQGRELDGTETWRFVVREKVTDASALLTLTSGASEISIDPTTNQPTVLFVAATLDVADFVPTEEPKKYGYGLEMTKDGSPETVCQGKMIVISDYAR